MIPIVKADGPASYPPRRSAFTGPFWDGLAAGELRTTRCTSCERFSFPPKPNCPHCWCREVRWVELGGRGSLYSWTRIHAAPSAFAAEAPYAVGVVDLDEGIRLATRVLEDGAPITIDGAVELVALAHDDITLFAARPLP